MIKIKLINEPIHGSAGQTKKKKGNHGKKKTCKKDNALLTELFQAPAKLIDLYPYFHVSGLHYKNRQSGQR